MMFGSTENRNRLPAGILLAISLLALRMNRTAEGAALPFDATVGLPGVGESRKVEKGVPFGFLFCLHAFDVEIDRVEITLALPPEVQRLGGDTAWKGDLNPQEETCLNVGLRSHTGMEKWSRPIHAQMKFIYQGMRVAREVTWNDQGLNDSDFVSKEK